jgi:hypothetical protein
MTESKLYIHKKLLAGLQKRTHLSQRGVRCMQRALHEPLAWGAVEAWWGVGAATAPVYAAPRRTHNVRRRVGRQRWQVVGGVQQLPIDTASMRVSVQQPRRDGGRDRGLCMRPSELRVPLTVKRWRLGIEKG